jgi:trk system potassium uptake protein TrkH
MAIAKAALVALITEAAGSLFLFARFSQDFSRGKAFYQAVYHAISAFNNAGFSLFSENLMGYQGDLIVNFTIMGLIVHGGIGFIVQYEFLAWLKGKQKRLSVHSKIVMITTAILISSGALLFYVFERNDIIKDAPVLNKFLVSLFQSVTPRTAGFNTVDIGALTNPTILL